MPLRYLQIFTPESDSINMDDLLEGLEVLGTWRDNSTENRMVIDVLVPTEEAEAIMDRFEQAYAGNPGFRLVVFPVEAALPRQDPSGTEAAGARTGSGDGDTDSANAARISREELYNDIVDSLGVDRVFVAMTVISSIVTAIGLLRDDIAIIIGAMVIAPLLGPNVAMSLATALGDLALLRRALFTNVVGISLTLMASIGVGVLFQIDPEIPAIAARTRIGIGDLVLALAAGTAGTLAFTRGMAAAVIGVMVAVALMPPLVTFGLMLGSGYLGASIGSLLLALANVVCVNLAGVLTLLLQNVQPRTWWEGKSARRAARIALLIWISLLILLGVIISFARISTPVGL